MAVERMAKICLIGPRSELDETLEQLHRVELVHLADAHRESYDLSSTPADTNRATRADELRFLATELVALLELAGIRVADSDDRVDVVPGAADVAQIRRDIEDVAPRVEALTAHRDRLEDERVILPRYIAPLRQLLPLIPDIADLTEDELRRLRLDTVALVLNTDDESVVALLREELAGHLDDRFELVHTRMDDGVIGCVLVFPHKETRAVHELLGKEHVRHVAVPKDYERFSLTVTVARMQERLAAIPGEIAAVDAELTALLAPRTGRWLDELASLRAELEQTDAAGLTGSTERTFVLVGWVPRRDLPALEAALATSLHPSIVIEEMPVDRHDPSAPVLLRNQRPARPFEFLVKLMDLPRPGTLDPTGLMTLFLPILFGAMVGDVIYGALLLVIAIVMKRRITSPGPLRDLASVLFVGSIWSIVFGVLFGEALGDLGKNVLGFDWALWFYRPDGLVPLLVFAIALGATHIVLGLALGIWQGWRERHRGEVLERTGTLLALVGVFGLAALAAGMLPGGTITPVIALIVVGLVLAMIAHGRMGVLMAPLELIGVLSNILSYLRIAAVGLASAYLAIVANRFAELGPIWFGIIVAAFFHALNLALAGFSPMIQSMRLHYVEFFSKFFAGGGHPFRAFGARADRRDRPVPDQQRTDGALAP
ncbi:V/A-type H+-transporting ATPase subunit I [Microbacterium sp. AK009]|uniref:V-type ATP synthase subunit I n=1 Tax=Microbacterium sp. AK009 TaxID=2723068 RepID=UPI0015C734BD|nr:V-type ATPase 116kDa subunit family protein [Microbacterium sp. AK009]NYF16573.1 V/A-type H+-transporting ATPase subunit I [Microbacterium sp. AK009]